MRHKINTINALKDTIEELESRIQLLKIIVKSLEKEEQMLEDLGLDNSHKEKSLNEEMEKNGRA